MPVELLSQADEPKDAIEIIVTTPETMNEACSSMSAGDREWLATVDFSAKSGQVCLLPSNSGGIAKVLFGAPKAGSERSALQFGKLTKALPAGTYRFSTTPNVEKIVALSWLLDAYQFNRYQGDGTGANDGKVIKLIVADEQALEEANRMGKAATLTRDLINTPTNDMGPEQLSDAMRDLADQYGASFSEIIGDDLIEQNFPLVHAVGRASESEPRLLDMRWGSERMPKITLVGKGVCFDTGGLNIKTGNFMTLMKKDMGGAANVLGLAQMIMDAELPVRLRVLIPAVENSIAGNAFRPGDILSSRLGLSVEIANTDAEGRLVLADALAYADEEAPDLLIDMATLTGAARVALGPDVPPFYTHDDGFAEELSVRARDMEDPVWRMPLWEPYQAMLDTPIADVNHAPTGGFAGSITAALFLDRFVKSAAIWGHFDIYGWTPTAHSARPKGGEAQAIRALYAFIKTRYN
ncbi:MAG: leucyl aminopeptidase family protein [Hyphomicrobiales bacterium]